MRTKIAAVLTLLLAACAQTPDEEAKTDTFTPTAITLDDADRERIADALERAAALPVGDSATWTGEGSKTGAVTTTRQGYARSGEECREYHAVVAQGDLRLQEVGFVCRDSDGAWKVVDLGGRTL